MSGAATSPQFAAQRMAAFASSLEFASLPPAVTDAARLHLLDAIGVGLAAASTQTRPRLEHAVAALGRGDESTGFGVRQPLPAPAAALLNGSFIHALEYDDTHMASVIHASAVLASAALGVAERERSAGAELLAAYVAGWEIITRVGMAAPKAFHARGFQPTAVAGAPVAAIVAGRLMGLDAATLACAAGIAGSQASGIFEFVSDGATVKMLHGGWPAHAGIMAAELARSGLTGPASVFEGERGILRAFTGDTECANALALELDDLGERWLLPEASFKPYPCCHFIQAAIECAHRIVNMGVDVHDVAEIECELPGEVAWLVCDPWDAKLDPASGHVAKFSLPYCLAAVFMDGQVDVDTFDRTRPDPRLRPLMQRISYRPMPDSGFPDRYPARLQVRTRKGALHEAEVMDVHGARQRPFSNEDVYAKFRRNAARTLDDRSVERVIGAIEALDRAADLTTLARALRSVT
ncbi:MAG: MmgE/PrpD family protein [Gammaproteobacteria bacterium]